MVDESYRFSSFAVTEKTIQSEKNILHKTF